jgi:uncharacterized RDD family membrane protein YckC
MEDSAHLLQDVEQEIYLEPASKGARLLNYIIDIIAFYVIAYLVNIILAIIILSKGTRTIQETSGSNLGRGTVQLALLFAFFLTLLAYYTLMEGFTKGRTIGKFITGTQAVSMDGSSITFKQAFIRSISRFVPFEPFSALGYTPWHDSWAGTVVIKKKK